MNNIHARYLTVEEVREIALPVVQRHLAHYGFSTLQVTEEESTGGPYLQLDAIVAGPVPAAEIEAIHPRQKECRLLATHLLFKKSERP